MRVSHNLPVPPPQPPASSAEVMALRTNWKWAYLSHFLFTFNPMLHLEDIQLSELEDDLANGTFEVLPTVMQRLLTSLTPHDKRSILENWQHHLRKQSLRRSPDRNIMGTEDAPVEFSSLIMTDRLHVLQSLCEWQFHNPNNLRTRMKDDDEDANWRIEPIANDSKGNAYWLMGGNRLWIQYAPPRKRPSRSHKRKRPATSTTNDRKSTKRGSAISVTSKPVVVQPASKPITVSSSTGRITRSTRSRQTSAASLNTPTPRIMGTRVSTRLRGREDIWQTIPEEWLKEGMIGDTAPEFPLNGTQKEKGNAAKETPLNSLDDASELTSLSDLSDIREESIGGASDIDGDQDEDMVEESSLSPSPDFSSMGEDMWETICVTISEWEAFPRRFEGSTHRGEKAFHKLLVNELVPMITETLRFDVRKKHIEEAVVHRKRSSRIAVKESIREAERAEARRKAEEEKEMERHKRWEARARKEEEERLRRDALRSARLHDKAGEGRESTDVDVVTSEQECEPEKNGAFPNSLQSNIVQIMSVVNGSKTGTPIRKEDEPWELDCEICHKRGMNLDDGLELMSCERCNKWQHIRCHDQADFIAGKPRRNWDVVDFLCSVCAGKDVGTSQLQRRGYLQQEKPTIPRRGGTNGEMRPHAHQKQPEPKSAHQFKPVSKPQTAFGPTLYKNVQTASVSPQEPYHMTAAAQYSQRHQPTTASNRNVTHLPYTSPQSHAPTPASYTSTPNLYLSNHSSSYRPPHTHNPAAVQPQNLPPPPHYWAQAVVPTSHAGEWLQQQTQYNQLAVWSGPSQDSASPHAGTSAPLSRELPQQNGYHHPTEPPSSLVQQQIASAQQYYTTRPASQL